MIEESLKSVVGKKLRNEKSKRNSKKKSRELKLIEERQEKVRKERAYGGCHRRAKAKKDAASGEMRRGAAGRQRSVDIRMGEPAPLRGEHRGANERGPAGARRREVKHLSTCRKRNQKRIRK